jgi:hypothetical protein
LLALELEFASALFFPSSLVGHRVVHPKKQ